MLCLGARSSLLVVAYIGLINAQALVKGMSNFLHLVAPLLSSRLLPSVRRASCPPYIVIGPRCLIDSARVNQTLTLPRKGVSIRTNLSSQSQSCHDPPTHITNRLVLTLCPSLQIRLVTTQDAPADTIRLWLERSGRSIPLDIEIFLQFPQNENTNSTPRRRRLSTGSVAVEWNTGWTQAWAVPTPPPPPGGIAPGTGTGTTYVHVPPPGAGFILHSLSVQNG